MKIMVMVATKSSKYNSSVFRLSVLCVSECKGPRNSSMFPRGGGVGVPIVVATWRFLPKARISREAVGVRLLAV